MANSDLQPDAFVLSCPSRALFARLGEKWSALIVVKLSAEPLRFGSLRRAVQGISQKMLTQNLRHLERDGLVLRRLLSDRPIQVEYSLSERGLALAPILSALKVWAEVHMHATHTLQAKFDALHGG